MRGKLRVCDKLLRNTRNIVCFFVLMSVLFVYRNRKVHNDQIRGKFSNSAIKFIDYQEQNFEEILHKDSLKRIVAKYNQEERILNNDPYRSLKNDAVFVIFVDKYKPHLKYLLASLEGVIGIAESLIVFSHSYFDDNVNNLIKAIDFAPVVQIYYPYSLQIYPQEFPGYKPGDCSRNIGIDTARYIHCTGANSPDIHGRYRDPVLSQMKHFWWWTLNTVFETLSHTKNHKGLFIFIDEDVFLLPDALYMTLNMKHRCEFISECDIVSLKSSSDPNLSETRAYGAEISIWDPKQHSGVIAFDIEVWNSIASHYYLFCNFDDYSWSRSLLHISLNRKVGSRFKVISSTVPRAYRINKMTSFSKQIVEYNIMSTVYDIMEMQKRNHEIFFPAQLELYLTIDLEYDDILIFDYADNNGGWADVRDREMCVNITKNKVRKLLLDMSDEFSHYRSDDDDDFVDDRKM